MKKEKPIAKQKGMTNLPAMVDSFQAGLTNYLQKLGLPYQNVLVNIEERTRVLTNLPSVAAEVPSEIRASSLYLSKFLAAVGAGLFDAALNFIWDETVQDLRRKVDQFDLEYFFDSVVTDPTRRAKLNSAEDLVNLDDWELIRGCHLTGILSDIGLKHLDYIRNMRNWASAAHPNQVGITGLQLVSWLETCIKEVLGKAPSAPAIEVKRLLHNIRTQVLTATDASPICDSISLLPVDLTTSLLRTLFGMYSDPKTSVQVKSNIKLVAKTAWDRGSDEIRNEIGIKYATYATNADIQRKEAGREFLTIVDGLTYLPRDTLTVEMNDTLEALLLSHQAFNNFYNEPPHARLLAKYVPDTGKIPDAIRSRYVKTVTMCYIGNGYGVSTVAYAYYQEMIEKYQDNEIYQVLLLPKDKIFASRLQFDDCKKRFRALLQKLKGKTVNPKLKKIIEYLQGQTDQQLPNVGKATDYEKMIKG